MYLSLTIALDKTSTILCEITRYLVAIIIILQVRYCNNQVNLI
jgi:hypothetical protein